MISIETSADLYFPSYKLWLAILTWYNCIDSHSLPYSDLVTMEVAEFAVLLSPIHRC